MKENVNKKVEPLILKDISIPYNTEYWKPRNFRGLAVVNGSRQVNPEGNKNFCVFLDPTKVDVDKLIEDGWNIKKSENKRDPQAEPTYLLRVKVKFHPEDSDYAKLNPKIIVITDNGEMEMDDDNVGDLDTAQIVKASMTIRGRWSETPGYTGVSAYLSKLVVRVYEDQEDSLEDLKASVMDN